MLINPCQYIAVKLPHLARLAFALATISLLPISCYKLEGRSFKPRIEGYNEQHARLFVLKKKLLEISGQVSFSDHEFIAINDEQGELIKFGLGENDKTTTKRFAGKGDYEDIVSAGPYFFCG